MEALSGTSNKRDGVAPSWPTMGATWAWSSGAQANLNLRFCSCATYQLALVLLQFWGPHCRHKGVGYLHAKENLSSHHSQAPKLSVDQVFSFEPFQVGTQALSQVPPHIPTGPVDRVEHRSKVQEGTRSQKVAAGGEEVGTVTHEPRATGEKRGPERSVQLRFSSRPKQPSLRPGDGSAE